MKTPDTITLRLSLTVRYLPNGVPLSELREMLHDIADHASSVGLMTRETPAEVDEWDAKVENVGEASQRPPLETVREWLEGDIEAAEQQEGQISLGIDTLRARLEGLGSEGVESVAPNPYVEALRNLWQTVESQCEGTPGPLAALVNHPAMIEARKLTLDGDAEKLAGLTVYEWEPKHVRSEDHTATSGLEALRQLAADAAFEAYNFREDCEVTDTGGWERDGVYWSRWVYIEGRNRVSFGVEFAPLDHKIVDRWVQD